MESVGYDMYCRLLDEAVREIEREQRTAATAAAVAGSGAGTAVLDNNDVTDDDKASGVSMDIHISAYIDGLYIEDEKQRLEMYQKIAAIRSDADADDVTDELFDRYSSIPDEAANLVRLARIKTLAADCGILSVNEKGGQFSMSLADSESVDLKRFAVLSKKYRGQVLLSSGKTPYITFKPQPISSQTSPRPASGYIHPRPAANARIPSRTSGVAVKPQLSPDAALDALLRFLRDLRP
jgi:transcription-repair coupling factor (superfamily II helicase)